MSDEVLYRQVKVNQGLANLLTYQVHEVAKQSAPGRHVTTELVDGFLIVDVELPWWAWFTCGAWHLWTWYRVWRSVQRTQKRLRLPAITRIRVK